MEKEKLDKALAQGREQGRLLVEARRSFRTAAAATGPKPFQGYLIAEGDSWFNYPVFDEVVEKLEDDHNYRVESAARWGDTADNMFYTRGGDGKELVKAFEKLQADARVPRAILLSCGGNDLAGDRFSLFLNHARSSSPGLNSSVVDAVFTSLEDTIARLIGLLKKLGDDFFHKDLPVVIHGYGYAVPDGRGFLQVSLFSGPWLAPSFEAKGYDTLADRVAIMTRLIDRFNDMQRKLAQDVAKVAYVDARPVLSNDLSGDKYQDSWANELHPTGKGFGEVANLFDAAIRRFPLP